MKRDGEDVFYPGDAGDFLWGPDWTAAGVIQVLEPLVGEARLERLAEVLERRLASVVVLMDAPHDPHNGAAVLRSADALGVQTVHVIPRDEPFQAARLVAKGSERWVDAIEHPSVGDAVRSLKSQGYTLVGAQATGRLTPPDLAHVPRIALVLGNETDGISEELRASVDTSVRIPMRGFVESLNVSVCAGILLAHAAMGRPGDLEPEHRQRVYAKWLIQSVRRARDVLAAAPPS